MSLRARLLGSYVAITLLLLLPSLYAAARLADLRDLAVGGRSSHASAALTVGRLQAGMADLNRYERSYVAAREPDLREAAERTMDVMRTEIDSLRDSPYSEPAERFEPMLDTITDVMTTIHAYMAEGRVSAATEAFGHLDALFATAQWRLRILADAMDRIAQQDFQRAQDISAAAQRSLLSALVVVLLLTLALGAWTAGALTRPLRRLAAATSTVADGKLVSPPDLPYDRNDEIGALSLSFRRMTRRLAELDRMKAEFVGVASHELKTPINVINGYTELIEEEMEGELTEHQIQILRGIAEQTRAMTRLVSWLMDISRLEAGTYRMEFDEVHLEDVMTGLLRSFDVLARAKGLNLTAQVRDSAPETLFIDLDIIRDEVLGNLVSNALQHTPEGGWIAVEAWGEGEDVVFQVSDSGAGIPEEHRPHIFEKYYQAERSRAVGAGLGLAIAREMVDAHGGTIHLEPPLRGARGHLPGAPAPHRDGVGAGLRSGGGGSPGPHLHGRLTFRNGPARACRADPSPERPAYHAYEAHGAPSRALPGDVRRGRGGPAAHALSPGHGHGRRL